MRGEIRTMKTTPSRSVNSVPDFLGRTLAFMIVNCRRRRIHTMYITSPSLVPASRDLNVLQDKKPLEVLKAEYQVGRERLAERSEEVMLRLRQIWSSWRI